MVINKKQSIWTAGRLWILWESFWERFWEDFGRKILPKSWKMLINLDLGRLQALKIYPTTLRDSGSRPSGMRHRKTLMNNKKKTKTQKMKIPGALESWSLDLWVSEPLVSWLLSHSLISLLPQESTAEVSEGRGVPRRKKKFSSDFPVTFFTPLAPPLTFPRSSPNCKTTWQIDC